MWRLNRLLNPKLIFQKEKLIFPKNISFYLQSGERLEVVKSPRVDGADLVHVQVQLGGLGWDALEMENMTILKQISRVEKLC